MKKPLTDYSAFCGDIYKVLGGSHRIWYGTITVSVRT